MNSLLLRVYVMELKKQWIFLILCTCLNLNSAGLPRIPRARHYRRRNIATGTLSPPFPGFNSPGFLRSTVTIKKSSSNKPSSNKPSPNKPPSSLTSSPTSVLTTTIISTSRATTLKLTKLPNRTSFTTSAKSYLVSTSERLPTAVSIFSADLGTGTTQYSLNVSSSSTAALYQSKPMYHTEKSTQRTTAFSSISSILNTGINTTNLTTMFNAPQTAHDQSIQPIVVIPVTLSFTFVSTIIFLTGVYILRTRCHRWRIQKVVPQTNI